MISTYHYIIIIYHIITIYPLAYVGLELYPRRVFSICRPRLALSLRSLWPGNGDVAMRSRWPMSLPKLWIYIKCLYIYESIYICIYILNVCWFACYVDSSLFWVTVLGFFFAKLTFISNHTIGQKISRKPPLFPRILDVSR